MTEEYRKWSEEQRKELEEIDKRKEELDRKVLERETQEELINIIIKLQKKNLNLSVEIDLLNNKIDKAIELIECSKQHLLEHDGSDIYLTRYCIDELLEILKDGDVDE